MTSVHSPGPAPEAAPAAPGLLTSRLGRLGPLMFIATLSWAIPATAGVTLLQAFFAQVDDATKIERAAVVGTVAAVSGAIAVIVAGALSDRTRTRLGRRKPWILGGALVSAVSLSLMPLVTSFGVVIVLYALFQVGLNAMVAALSALLPDRVGSNLLGKISAVSGVGNLLGLALAGFLAAAFIDVPRTGLAAIPWGMVVAALLITWLLPTEAPVTAEERTGGSLLASLRPPGDRDFWLAFIGRLTFLLSLLMVVAYQLFLLTDHFGLSTTEAAELIAIAGLILAVGAGVSAAVAGPLSDRIGRRKPLVIGSAVVVALGSAMLFVPGGGGVFLLYTAVVSLAYGTFISVDQALMVEVLPDKGNSARDLGFLSAANTAPGIIAPALAGALVSLFGFPALFVAGVVIALISIGCVLPIRRVR